MGLTRFVIFCINVNAQSSGCALSVTSNTGEKGETSAVNSCRPVSHSLYIVSSKSGQRLRKSSAARSCCKLVYTTDRTASIKWFPFYKKSIYLSGTINFSQWEETICTAFQCQLPSICSPGITLKDDKFGVLDSKSVLRYLQNC